VCVCVCVCVHTRVLLAKQGSKIYLFKRCYSATRPLLSSG